MSEAGRLSALVADALPRGHFLALALCSVRPGLNSLTVANCGLPPLLLCGQHGLRDRIESSNFALGIVRDACFDGAVRSMPIARGEYLVIASDGVSEAVNRVGEAFGEARLESLLALPDGASGGAPAVVSRALDLFRGGTPYADDVSVVELRFTQDLFGQTAAPPADTTGAREFA